MLTEEILEQLRIAVQQYTNKLLTKKKISAQIDSIILYGSAAKSYFKKNGYRDFDLNVFLVKTGAGDLRTINKRGVIWTLPNLIQSKKVEVLFNKLLADKTWIEYIKTHKAKSNRWRRMSGNPILLIFPKRENYNNPF